MENTTKVVVANETNDKYYFWTHNAMHVSRSWRSLVLRKENSGREKKDSNNNLQQFSQLH